MSAASASGGLLPPWQVCEKWDAWRLAPRIPFFAPSTHWKGQSSWLFFYFEKAVDSRMQLSLRSKKLYHQD
jgi:hypothetical protein